MSWKRQDPFNMNDNVDLEKKNRPERPYMKTIEKEVAFRRLEAEIIQTDIIESKFLMMNGKDVIMTTDRLNINTPSNRIQVPNYGPVKINKVLKINENQIQVDGPIHVNNEVRFNTQKTLVKKLTLNPRTIINYEDYSTSNHFIIYSDERRAKGELVLNPYQHYTAEWSPNKIDYLYNINICLSMPSDSLVDIDIFIPHQELTIKLQSRYSSLSLLWSPEGKWLVNTLGFKTFVVDI